MRNRLPNFVPVLCFWTDQISNGTDWPTQTNSAVVEMGFASLDVNYSAAKSLLQKYPICEVLTLFVLALITVFRRRLSSNDEYRRKAPDAKQSYTKQSPLVVRSCDKGKKKIVFGALSQEVTIHIVSYLANHDIACLMATSQKMYKDISADFIWEQLWLQTYSAMWQHPEVRKIREGRGIFWDPMLNYGPPQQGWYRFFLLFEVSWIDYILAGYCTHSRCLIGVNNAIVDVTNFIHVHPGSPETLSEGAGCDATDTFNEIGHSTYAERLMGTLKIWDCDSNNIPTCLCNDIHLQQNLCGHCTQGLRVQLNPKCQPILTCQKRHFPGNTKLLEHMKINQKKVTELASRKHKEAASEAHTAETSHELQFDGFSAVIPLLEAAATSSNASFAAVMPLLEAAASSGNASPDNFSDVADNDSADTDDDSAESDSLPSSDDNYIDTDADSEDDGMPEVSHQGFTSAIFSPSKSLNSILDKITREVRKRGSMQRSGVSNNHNSSGQGDNDSVSSYTAPLASYFGPPHRMVGNLSGYFGCVNPQDHIGQPKAFFDPFTEEWTAWWSCCGQGQVLVEADHVPAAPVTDTIFCK